MIFLRFLGIAFLKNVAVAAVVIALARLIPSSLAYVTAIFLVALYFVNLILTGLFVEWAFHGMVPSRATTLHLMVVWFFVSVMMLLTWAMRFLDNGPLILGRPEVLGFFALDLVIIVLFSMRLRRKEIVMKTG